MCANCKWCVTQIEFGWKNGAIGVTTQHNITCRPIDINRQSSENETWTRRRRWRRWWWTHLQEAMGTTRKKKEKEKMVHCVWQIVIKNESGLMEKIRERLYHCVTRLNSKVRELENRSIYKTNPFIHTIIRRKGFVQWEISLTETYTMTIDFGHKSTMGYSLCRDISIYNRVILDDQEKKTFLSPFIIELLYIYINVYILPKTCIRIIKCR